jgi:hypothetical protein
MLATSVSYVLTAAVSLRLPATVRVTRDARAVVGVRLARNQPGSLDPVDELAGSPTGHAECASEVMLPPGARESAEPP